jgi:hypothetical protein
MPVDFDDNGPFHYYINGYKRIGNLEKTRSQEFTAFSVQRTAPSSASSKFKGFLMGGLHIVVLPIEWASRHFGAPERDCRQHPHPIQCRLAETNKDSFQKNSS